MATDLIDRVQETFPEATPMWAGGPDPDSAYVEFGGRVLVVTHWHSETYDIGVYASETAWQDGDDPLQWHHADSPDAVLLALDSLTE